jgi:hypothetical protein
LLDIEYTLQQTSRAVYCLARGVGTQLDETAAAAIVKWLNSSKELAVDRHGPARAPGPDGSTYEWFFRLASVQGIEFEHLEELFEAAQKRLRPVFRKQSRTEIVPDIDGGVLDEFLASERTRANAYLLAEIRRLQRALAAGRQVFINQLRRRESKDKPADREIVDRLLDEAIERTNTVELREADVQKRELELESKRNYLDIAIARQRTNHTPTERPGSYTADLAALLPRLHLGGESLEFLQIDLSSNPAYLRFLCALQDGVKIDPSTNQSVLKHEKLTAAKGKTKKWWEVRLKNSVAKEYRIYYQHLENREIEVHIVHKSEQERFIAGL